LRFRGVPVGDVSGLGINGYHVKVEKELEVIGLLVAASSYLIYSTA
jgi:ABC-type transporter Mla subunit MlaD